MKSKMKFYVLIEIILVFSGYYVKGQLSSYEITEIQESCCTAGTEYAMAKAGSSSDCASEAAMPDDIEAEAKDTCRESSRSCCEEQFKAKEDCSDGIKYAETKRCSVPKSEMAKTCCEECSFGRLTGESQGRESCGSPADGDVGPTTALRKNTYHKCCLEAAEKPETTTERRTTTTTQKVREKCKTGSCDHICNDSEDRISCQCRDGFRLQSDKKTCKDINECAEAVDDLCLSENTVCHNVPGSFRCVPIRKREARNVSCPAGYKPNLENKACDDINECKLPNPPCPRYACENTVGAYKCGGKIREPAPKPTSDELPEVNNNESVVETSGATTPNYCPKGLRPGSDGECDEDVDECEEKLDDCNRLSQNCINEHGDFFCQDHGSKYCKPGFRVNRVTEICEDINECEGITEVCKRNEICINLAGAYKCKSKISTLPKLSKKSCQEGTRSRTGSTACEDINECQEGTHLCDQFQNCINTYGSHECRCKNGFEMDQVTSACVDIDECAQQLHNCAPDKHCLNVPGTYTCTYRPPTAWPTTTSTTTTTPSTPTTSIYEYYYSDEDNITSSENNNELPPLPEITQKPRPTTTSTTPRPASTSTTPRPTTTSTTPKPTTTSTTPKPTTTSTTPKPTPTTTSTTPRPTSPSTNTTVPRRRWRPPYRPTTPYNRTPPTTIKPTTPIYNMPIPPAPTLPPRPDEGNFDTENVHCLDGFEKDYDGKCVDINECENSRHTCMALEQCMNEPGGFRCECTRGFRRDPEGWCRPDNLDATENATTPSEIRPYVPTRPEVNRGVSRPPSDCGLGYKYDYKTESCVDIDECALELAQCSRDEECVNFPGGYGCQCREPWCNRDAGTNPISRPSMPPALPSGSNIITVGSEFGTRGPFMMSASRSRLRGSGAIMASCPWGYHLAENDMCIDTDECSARADSCGPQQTCENYPGGYSCRCPNGHRLSGQNQCQDVDECAIRQPCPESSTCINTVGSYRCSCGSGFRTGGDSTSCTDIDECVDTPSVCQQKCANTWGGYRCYCDHGYDLGVDNRTCEDVDECKLYHLPPKTRLCSALCINTPGSYRCECPAGYRQTSDRRGCVDIDECQTGEARCGSEVCVNTQGSYRCRRVECPPGYRLEDKTKCSRIQRSCMYGDYACLGRPSAYSYYFITLVTGITVPTGGANLLTVHGPRWSDSQLSFELELLNVRADDGVRPADISCFEMRPTGWSCGVSLICPLGGPQEVMLELRMSLMSRGQSTAAAAARIVVIVTPRDF